VSPAHFSDKLRVPGRSWCAQTHDEQQGLALAFDLVVQVDAVDLSVWHSLSFRLPLLEIAAEQIAIPHPTGEKKRR
jgi:hypothetical protein